MLSQGNMGALLFHYTGQAGPRFGDSGSLVVGGALIKKLASFRHKTQKFFFLAGSPLGIFLLTLRFFLIPHRFADRPTSPIFHNPTHPLLIQCHRYTPPGNKFAWFERVLA